MAPSNESPPEPRAERPEARATGPARTRRLEAQIHRLASAVARPRTLRWLQVGLAVLLVGALVRLVDWRSLAGALGHLDAVTVTEAAALLAAVLLVGAFDLWILLGALAPLPYGTMLRIYVVAWSSFLALPGSAGDAVQILLLRDSDVGYRQGTAVYLADKLVTLGVNLAVVAVGGSVYLRAQVRSLVLVALAAIGVAVAAGLYWLARRSSNPRVRRGVELLDSARAFAAEHPGRIAANVAGTGTKLLLTAGAAWLVLRGLGAEVAFPAVLVVHFAAALVAYLPIAFNGIGTVELAAVTLYGGLGVEPRDVLALYVVLRASVFALAGASLAIVAISRRASRREP